MANALPGTPTATGDLLATDVDNPLDAFQAVAAGAPTANGYGSYDVNAAGVWTYTLNNALAAVQALNVGSVPLTRQLHGPGQRGRHGPGGDRHDRRCQRRGRHHWLEHWHAGRGRRRRQCPPGHTDCDGRPAGHRCRQPAGRLPGGGRGAATANGYGSYEVTAAGVWTLHPEQRQRGGAGAQRRQRAADRQLHRLQPATARPRQVTVSHQRRQRRGGDHRRPAAAPRSEAEWRGQRRPGHSRRSHGRPERTAMWTIVLDAVTGGRPPAVGHGRRATAAMASRPTRDVDATRWTTRPRGGAGAERRQRAA